MANCGGATPLRSAMQPTGEIPKRAAGLAQGCLAGEAQIKERRLIEAAQSAALCPDRQHIAKTQAPSREGGAEGGGVNLKSHGHSFPFGDVAKGSHFSY